jgi:hypothetical protein
LIAGFFRTLSNWVDSGTIWLLREAWHAMSATTEPTLTGSAFTSEYHLMILIAAGTILPLLGLAVIQAVAHQDPGGLLRTALLRLPMALLLTGVVIELVSLGLTFTDQASAAMLSSGADPAARAFARIEAGLAPLPTGAAGFGELLLAVVVAFVGFMLWVELAVRSAAVAVATLFLPLALAGLVWPVTAHWARRLGETLAGLVLMKLVMAAVLALAGGALAAGAGGIASVVEGVALLGLTTFSPFALFRLIPAIEAGAVAHLEGARPAQTAKNKASSMASDGARQLRGAMTGSLSGSVPASGQATMAGLPGAGGDLYAGVGAGRVGGAAGATTAAGSATTGSASATTSSGSRSGSGRDDGRAAAANSSASAGNSSAPAGSSSAEAGRPRGAAGWLQTMSDRAGSRHGTS